MLTDPATFGRLILSLHKIVFSSKSASICAINEFGKIPKFGTREHISELSSVKNARRVEIAADFSPLQRDTVSVLKHPTAFCALSIKFQLGGFRAKVSGLGSHRWIRLRPS